MNTATAVVWTSIQLAFKDQEINYQLIFGAPGRRAGKHTDFNESSETVYFETGAIFGLDLWEGAVIRNAAGDRRTRTRMRSCFVLQAGGPGEQLIRVPHVQPGARVLIAVHGVKRSKFLRAWIEELGKRTDLEMLPADFFQRKSLQVGGMYPDVKQIHRIGFVPHGAH